MGLKESREWASGILGSRMKRAQLIESTSRVPALKEERIEIELFFIETRGHDRTQG